MSWSVLPTELKLNILQHLLAFPLPIDHAVHTDNLVCGVLETLISTSNTELVNLSLEACMLAPKSFHYNFLLIANSDYKTNAFVIKTTTTYTGAEETKTFRPREKHAREMKHLIDETVPLSPQAGVPVPIDSGYASRDSESVDGDAAPAVADLACALEAAVMEDSAVKQGDRQRKLFEYVNHRDYFLRSQRKTMGWKEAQAEFGKSLWKTNRAHFQ
jgi:hypothetical protein